MQSTGNQYDKKDDDDNQMRFERLPDEGSKRIQIVFHNYFPTETDMETLKGKL